MGKPDKKLMSQEEAEDSSNFEGKTVLITGCTHGIGDAAFYQLMIHRKVKKIILVNRNRELSGDRAQMVRDDDSAMEVSEYFADLSRPAEVLRVVKEIVAAEPELDVALLNAGYWKCVSDVERVTQEDGLEFHYAVNYLQQVLLAEGLAPLMSDTARKTPGGESRIVIVGSFTAFDIAKGKLDMDLLRAPEGRHEDGFPNGFCYSQSKLAQHVWTKAIVEDQGGLADNVTVNIVCPGGVETNNEVIHLLKKKTGCMYGCIAGWILGQRPPTEGCKTLLCAGGSKALDKVSGKHLTFGTGGKLVYNGPCDAEFFPQSKWAECPSVADKELRLSLLKDTAEVVQQMKDKYK